MENASKALIMSAGILISVLILSLAAYLIATFGSSSAEIQKINEEKIISEFNSQFTVYDRRKDLTIYDVVTVANYAKENNEKFELTEENRGKENTYYISVKLKGNSPENLENMTSSKQNELLKEDLQSQSKYSCTVEISVVTKRVYKVIFKKI